LWFKNKERFINTSLGQDLDFSTVTPSFTTYDLSSYVNTTNNSIHVEYIDSQIINHFIRLNVTSVSSSDPYYIDIYQNGNLMNSIQGAGVQSHLLDIIQSVIGLDSVYTFQIRTEGANNIALNMKYQVSYFQASPPSLITDEVAITLPNAILAADINLSANAPAMKVADFLKGIMLMFNMTIYSIKDKEYWLEPLDDWYSKGAVVDISQYTDVTSIEMERMPLYKKIQFKFTRF
jgi:hypothetical protein